jgi:trehalose 6-phosphate synthase/phosphatase
LQTKELQDHLESVLANEPVTVKRGAQIVEVTPQVCSRAKSNQLARMKYGTVLVIIVCLVQDDIKETKMDEYKHANNGESVFLFLHCRG